MSFVPTLDFARGFLAISILCKEIIVAVDATNGSTSEYHELMRKLLSLERAFLEFGLICQILDPTPELVATNLQARRIADQCKSCIETFLDTIYDHTKVFQHGDIGNKLRDAFSKVARQFEKDNVTMFRTEITTHSATITILLQGANRYSAPFYSRMHVNCISGGF